MPRTQTYEGIWRGESTVGASGPGQRATSLVLASGGTLIGSSLLSSSPLDRGLGITLPVQAEKADLPEPEFPIKTIRMRTAIPIESVLTCAAAEAHR